MYHLLALALAVVCTGASAVDVLPWRVAGLGDDVLLATRDAARYLRLLRCGSGPSSSCVTLGSAHEGGATTVLVAPRALVPAELQSAWAGASRTLGDVLADLTSDDAHVVHTVADGSGGAVTVCSGATPRATLYAVYALLQACGARFYLSGDVLPPPNASLALPSVHARPLVATPTFAVRGIQPFHDFPQGPDFWSADYYKAIATQMVKMRLNRWGFHTYPFGGAGPEPLVWVGAASGFDAASGNVSADGAYTSSWYLTENFPRGNLPGSVSRATSDYCCGAAAVFPRDCFGSDAQAAECWPSTAASDAAVLNNAASLLRDSTAWAAAAGITTCLGTEVPLTRPPSSNATLAELYAGMFARVAAATPAVTCFWLWTTESVEDHSNGKGLPQSNPLWAQLTAEIGVALAARDAVAPHLDVGVNGWCLGPGDNSSFFDHVIQDPRFSLAAISGCLGWCDVDAGFASVTAHAGTAITWLEDDMGLAGAELWVERTLAQGRASAAYNVSGFMGLLWRTWETMPQMAALTASAWDPNATTLGVYADFCAAQFGPDTAAECAALFVSIDGATEAGAFTPSAARLPRGGQGCCGGPLSPTGEEGAIQFLDTSPFEAWAATVVGPANRERAGRWVSQLQYHAAMASVCIAGQALEAAAARVVDEASAREFGFPALAALSWAWTGMMTSLLEFTTTPGELGMLAAHEGMNWVSSFFAAAAPILPFLLACVPAEEARCFADNYTTAGRTLPYTVTLNNAHNSREWCARECATAGYALAGVEFGVACFCGNTTPTSGELPVSACAAMPCAGAPSERCGDADVVSVYSSSCPPLPGVPPGILPSQDYAGAPRMWQTVTRTTVAAAEGALTVEVAVLAPSNEVSPSVSLTWWLVPGSGGNSSRILEPVGDGRGLWATTVPLPADTAAVLEYVVQATGGAGAAAWSLVVPVEGAQSVVVV